jgi:hypothetical protein
MARPLEYFTPPPVPHVVGGRQHCLSSQTSLMQRTPALLSSNVCPEFLQTCFPSWPLGGGVGGASFERTDRAQVAIAGQRPALGKSGAPGAPGGSQQDLSQGADTCRRRTAFCALGSVGVGGRRLYASESIGDVTQCDRAYGCWRSAISLCSRARSCM